LLLLLCFLGIRSKNPFFGIVGSGGMWVLRLSV
jgi:hypothetical protein